MIDREYLQYMTGERSYFRGLQIYNSGKILDYSIEETIDGDYVEARVMGSGRNVYQVNMRYDLEMDDVDYVECDCPAYYSYGGICKHCVAVILKYMDEKNQIDSMSELENQEIGVGEISRQPETTPEIKKLLSDMVMEKLLPINQDKVFGKVQIKPYLTCDRYETSLKFKIGVSRMYVLKDVLSFADAIENKKEISYGQKLKFLHMIDAFEPESRKLAAFICRWASQNRDMYRQYSYYENQFQKVKVMTLNARELEDFFEIMGKQKIKAEIDMDKERSWQLTDEPLLRYLEITGLDQGIEVKVEPILGYCGDQYFVYFQNQKIYRISKKEMGPICEFVVCLAKMPGCKVFIQKDDVPLFCREMLPILEQFYQCNKVNFNEKDYGFIPVSFEIYLDAPQKNFVTCEILAVYKNKKYNIYDQKEDRSSRDIVKEAEIGKIATVHFNAYDERGKKMVIAKDDELIYEFLTEGIAQMQKIGEVFISDVLKNIKVAKAPKVTAGISLSGDLLELSISTGDMPRNQLMEILSKYDRKKKFYRLKNGTFITLKEDEDIIVMQELKKKLSLTDSQMKEEKILLPKYRALYLDSELKDKRKLPFNRSLEFRKLIENMKTVEENAFDVPDSLTSTLREYQKKGFQWMKTLKHNGFGGILADDMGLGKTLQVITLLLSEYKEDSKRNPTLVITPASLVFNWISEIQTFAPELSVKTIIGTAAEREALIKDIQTGDIVITSYDLLKRDIEQYNEMVFDCQVIDEAQYIKNHNTQASKAVKRIQAGFKLALTGTPVENRLSELWSIFDYLMHGFLYSYQKFRREMEQPIVQNQDEDVMEHLQKMIRPFVLRRLKKDVLKDLPEKLEKVVYVKLEGEQQKLYHAHVQRLQMMLEKQSPEEFQTSKIQILAELMKLRQICCHPGLIFDKYQENSGKTEVCLDLLENAVNGGHKILLFSQFVSVFEGLCKNMDQRGLSYMTLTGKDSKEKRREMVEQFQTGDVSIFCISLKAGGTGLNLTAADIVIHYDPWWNLAVQNQATDRVHRIGQVNTVVEYKLIMKDTIEEKIIQLQEKKKKLAEQILEGNGIDSGSFSQEEIMELLNDTL